MRNAIGCILVISLLLSCTKGDSSEKTLSDVIDESMGGDVDKYTGKLDELLSLDIASDALGYVPEEAEMEYSQVLKNPKTHSIIYIWDMGKMTEIKVPGSSMTVKVPQKDRIQLSWLQAVSQEEFNRMYRTPTQEELEQADKAIQKKMDEMVAEGKISAQNANVGSGMASRLGKGLSFKDIEGVGDQAKWNEKDQDLVVYYKGLMFQIRVESEDAEEEKMQKSIKAAKRIIKDKL